MQTEITFRNIDHSLAIEKIIHKKIHKLQQTANNIIACHAIIEKTKTNRKEQISIFSLTIKVDIPGKTVVVSGKQNQDIYVLIRDSFKGILRKLEAYRDNQNLKTKHKLGPKRTSLAPPIGSAGDQPRAGTKPMAEVVRKKAVMSDRKKQKFDLFKMRAKVKRQ